jgi:hypothetical protein
VLVVVLVSRLNVLYYGSASDAADELDIGSTPTASELRVALVNALRRIAVLEGTTADLDPVSPLELDPK